MDAKLILKLDSSLIKKAKEYASNNNRSLSTLIETYLKSLTDKESNNNQKDIEISLFVKSMKTGVQIPANLDEKKEYEKYLSEKYQ
jgi:hypothetical protein